MAQSTDEDIKIIKGNLDKLERALACADENGLFKTVTNAPNFTDIIGNMADAIEVLDNEKIPPAERVLQAWKKYRLANHQYYKSYTLQAFGGVSNIALEGLSSYTFSYCWHSLFWRGFSSVPVYPILRYYGFLAGPTYGV